MVANDPMAPAVSGYLKQRGKEHFHTLLGQHRGRREGGLSHLGHKPQRQLVICRWAV